MFVFISSWSPLHEAAWNGHLECAKALLTLGLAPLKPRTNKDETPADLAKANSKKDVADFLDNWEWPTCISEEDDWMCAKDIDRKEAVELLSKHPKDGTFLVRRSNKKKNLHVLSTIYEKTCCHFVIEARGVYFFLEDGPYMPSIGHLIDHYSRYADGLPFKLCYPIFKMLQFPLALGGN